MIARTIVPVASGCCALHAKAPHRENLPDPNALALQLIGRDYLSYSSVSTYQKCPLRFYFQYVAALPPEFVPASLVFGGSIHAAIEQHFRRLLEGAGSPNADELRAAFDTAWQSETVIPVRYGASESEPGLRDLAGRMLTAFLASEVSKLDGQLLAVEEEFRGPVIPGSPDLLGRVDLVLLTQTALKVIDFKTSRSAWNDGKIKEAAPQQLLYAELVRPLAEAFGQVPIVIEWIVLTKTKQPTVERHTLTPDVQQIARTKAVVRNVWHAIAAGHFYPSPSNQTCATCPFGSACRKWEG